MTCLGIGAVEVKLFTGFAVVEFASSQESGSKELVSLGLKE